jgi:hypothetical protein
MRRDIAENAGDRDDLPQSRGSTVSSRFSRIFIAGVFGLLLAAGMVIVVRAPDATVAAQTNPTNQAKEPLDCLSCHPRQMQYHDKLGLGNRACWVCHDSTDMKVLHLPDGTALTLDDSAPLCGQCHGARYQAWLEGTHGLPLTDLSAPKAQCSICHHQHAPQVVFANITLPHPAPQPAPGQPSTELLVLFGTASVLVVTVGIVLVKRR